MKNIAILLVITIFSCFSNNRNTDNGFLYAKKTSNNKYAFFNKKGKKILGDYHVIYTKILKDYAIVANPAPMLIDKKGKVVYHIFVVDNGPDYTKDGFYRIIKNGKIGYVDSLTSKLAVPATYKCAFPFEKGKAKVSNDCNEINDGEYTSWKSNKWFYINKKGIVIK